MKNKIEFLIILLFCVLLAGCKAGNPETTEKTIQEPSTETTEGPSTTEDETEEPTTLSSRKIVVLEEEQLSQESVAVVCLCWEKKNYRIKYKIL